MRSKLWKVLVAAMIILTLCFALVACKPNDEGDNEQPDKEEATALIDEMVGKLTTDLTIKNARRLNIDLSGAVTLQELEGENPLFWKYELIAKGNINLTASAQETDSNFRIELNSYTKDGAKTNLFSLLYESELGEDNKYSGSYFYLMLPGQETPLKINAIALLKVIAGSDETMDAIDVAEYLGIGLAVMAKDAERVGEDSYKITTDMNKIWELVEQIVLPMLDDPDALNNLIPGLGIDLSGIIDGAIPEIFKGLTYKGVAEDGAEIDKPVESLNDLINYVKQNLPKIDISLNFNFNGDTFKGGSIVADYGVKDSTKPSHKFTVDLYSATLGAGKYIAYDDGYSLTAQERKEMATSSNLLTFSVDGKMNFVSGSGDKLKTVPYTISLQADINPLVLIGDVFTISKLNDIGKLSLTVVDDTTGDVVLTLYCDGADKELIVSYKTPGSHFLVKNIAIGGEYSFEALGAIINAMSPATASQALSNMSDEEAGQDAVAKIMSTVFDNLDFSQMGTKGLIINNPKAIITEIFANIDLDLAGFDSIVVGAIHDTVFGGANSVEIGVKENGFNYGVCNMPNKADIVLPGHLDNFNTYGKLLDDSKAVTFPGLQTTYEFGEAFRFDERGGSGSEAKHTITVNGKDRENKSATFSGVYYGQTGYDPNKAGEQTVTVYYGLNSGIATLLNNSLLAGPLGGLSQWTPLFGAHKQDIKVTVYPKISEENTVLIVDGSTTMFANESIAENLNATLRYSDANGNIREVKVTDSMISCKKPVVENGKFLYFGKYTLDINYKGIKISQNVTVNEIVINQTSNIGTAGSNPLSDVSLQLKIYTETGEIKITDLTIDKILSVHDSKNNVLNDVLDDNGKFTTNIKYNKTKFYMILQYNMDGALRTIRIDYDKILGEDKSLVSANTSTVLSTPVNFEWTTFNSTYKMPYVYALVNGKEYIYGFGYDAELNKFIPVPWSASYPEWSTSSTISMMFTKTHNYDTTTNKFVEVEGAQTPFTFSADKLTIEAGKYDVVLTIGNTVANYKAEFLPKAAIVEYTSSYGASSITSVLKVNWDVQHLITADAKTINASIKWDTASKKYKLAHKVAKGTSTTDVFIDENIAKIEISGQMLQDGKEWVEAKFADNGSFLRFTPNASTGKYATYKLKVKVTLETETFEFDVTVNDWSK